MGPFVNDLLVVSVILAVLWITMVLVQRSLRGLRGLGGGLTSTAAGAERVRQTVEREVIELHQRWDAARRNLEPLEPGQATEQAVRLARRHLDELVDQVPTGAQCDTALLARASVKAHTSIQALEVMAAERRKSS